MFKKCQKFQIPIKWFFVIRKEKQLFIRISLFKMVKNTPIFFKYCNLLRTISPSSIYSLIDILTYIIIYSILYDFLQNKQL